MAHDKTVINQISAMSSFYAKYFAKTFIGNNAPVSNNYPLPWELNAENRNSISRTVVIGL